MYKLVRHRNQLRGLELLKQLKTQLESEVQSGKARNEFRRANYNRFNNRSSIRKGVLNAR